MKQTIEVPVSIELTVEEMALVEAGLRLLLMVEDDHDTIARLKELLKRVQQKIAVHAVQAATDGSASAGVEHGGIAVSWRSCPVSRRHGASGSNLGICAPDQLPRGGSDFSSSA